MVESAVVTGMEHGSLFAAFLRLHGISVEGLRREIGHENISRSTLDNLVRGKVTPYGRTIRAVLGGLNRLVPRRRFSRAGFLYIVKRAAPAMPEAQLALIEKAVEMSDDEKKAS